MEHRDIDIDADTGVNYLLIFHIWVLISCRHIFALSSRIKGVSRPSIDNWFEESFSLFGLLRPNIPSVVTAKAKEKKRT